MNPGSNLPHAHPRPFWQNFLIILGADTLIVLAGALLFQDPGQISNFYFMSSIVLFIIAVIPIVSEVGTSAKIAGKAIKDGEKVNVQLEQKQAIFNRSARTTYLYGLAGLVTLLLSLITLPLG